MDSRNSISQGIGKNIFGNREDMQKVGNKGKNSSRNEIAEISRNNWVVVSSEKIIG